MNSPPQQDSWIGRLIGDRQRYRITQRLDSGGMGYVFLAMDILLGQQVALKLLKETLARSEELRKRFEREVALCAALKSDHVVEVNDYGVTSEGHPFYVMEYLRGQSLGQLLRREKRLSVKRAVDIVCQVCDGLQLAHKGVTLWRHGATASEHVKVVHRDLKPDNIFLVPTTLGELVKILDFGIARKISDDAVEQTNLTSTFLGTFRYAAPEQLGVAKNLDGRADIYSLGIILYEMLSGADPFGFGIKARSTTGVSWAMAHTSKPPQPLRLQLGCEQLSPELEAVVIRCLQKAPHDRFASVEELHQALQAAARFEMSVPTGQGVPDATIAQVSPLTAPGGNTTVNRAIAASNQIPDATIAQPQRDTGPQKQEVPDATIAQISPVPTLSSDDSTVSRPLAAGQGVPDAVIAPTQPPKQSAGNTTVPRQRTPARQEVPDATIAQIPPESRLGSHDNTVSRPLAAGQIPDATTAQVQPSRQGERDTTILQQKTPDVTIAQIPPPPTRQEGVPNTTIVQDRTAPGRRPRRLPTHFLLPLGIGVAIGLVAISAIFAYMQSQQRQTVMDDIQTLKTQARFEECIIKAKAVSHDSQVYNDAQTLLNECLMGYAKKLAAGKDFQSALTVAREIPEDSSLHSEAQSLISQWTKQIDKSI